MTSGSSGGKEYGITSTVSKSPPTMQANQLPKGRTRANIIWVLPNVRTSKSGKKSASTIYNHRYVTLPPQLLLFNFSYDIDRSCTSIDKKSRKFACACNECKRLASGSTLSHKDCAQSRLQDIHSIHSQVPRYTCEAHEPVVVQWLVHGTTSLSFGKSG